MANQVIKVLIVDDSAFIRHTLQKRLLLYSDIHVIDVARNGVEALARIPELNPDVIVLDVEMPQMDGLTALKHIMTEFPTPVIMLSALTQHGTSTTIRALMRGAVDFVSKPDANVSLHNVIEELVKKIRLAAQMQQVKFSDQRISTSTLEKVPPRSFNNGDKLIIIGTSTGGPRALRHVIPSLPTDLPAAVLIVQHMPAGYTTSFAQRLNELSLLTVREAAEGDHLACGLALLAPGGFHLKVNKKRVFLDEGPPRNHIRPSVDITMETAVSYFGSNIIGIILTGMGVDGTDGAAAIKAAGGTIIAENEQTSIVNGMPGSVVKAGLADYVLSTPEIAPALVELVYG